MQYTIFDVPLESDIALPELPAAEAGAPSPHLGVRLHPGLRIGQVRWIQRWCSCDGTDFLHVGMAPEGYWLRFLGLQDFLVSLDCRAVYFEPSRTLNAYTLRHLLVDQVLPRMLGQSGELILHGALVNYHQRSFALLGQSGAGKSTLAASFAAAGGTLLSDDCFAVRITSRGVSLVGNYAGVRLFEDSAARVPELGACIGDVAHYSSKQRYLSPGAAAQLPAPGQLDGMFLLEKSTDQAIDLEPVAGADQLMALIEQLFLVDPGNKTVMRQHFETFDGLLAARPAVYRLQYPRQFDLLPAVRQALERVF
ncbi:hypothetical protein E2F43_15225 [Seongchinamella unica]|uniref:HPr kinase n=1 Tax=Seongchinamella unica TaxID=2547392 RepID=A0A4R5LQY1_9GAMM|nr:hypothetical protein [Seongchinamella unica]TDG12905.1 hypothetical protein E2F43_15225 [Seongchinamella unica]